MRKLILRSNRVMKTAFSPRTVRLFSDIEDPKKTCLSCSESTQASSRDKESLNNAPISSKEEEFLFSVLKNQKKGPEKQSSIPKELKQGPSTIAGRNKKLLEEAAIRAEKLQKDAPKVVEIHEEEHVERAIKKKKFSFREWFAEEWHKLKCSMRQIRTDAFRLYVYLLTKQGQRTYTIEEFIDKEKIKSDLIKFIPYGILIIIPGAELLIPFYIGLFPNGSPSQFSSESKIGKKIEKKEDVQKDAFEALYEKIRPFFTEELKEIKTLQKKIKADPFNHELALRISEIDSAIAKELIENWHKYKKKLKFANLSLPDMETAVKFLFVDYVSGVHILNVLLNLPQKIVNWMLTRVFKSKRKLPVYYYPMDIFPLNRLRRYFLENQLKKFYKRLEVEDYLVELHPNTLEKLSSTEIYEFSRQRGITVDHDDDRINYHKDIWTSQAKRTPKLELRFWLMVLRFSYGKHLV